MIWFFPKHDHGLRQGSSPGGSPRQHGFTLLELLVVLLIMGIVASTAMLSLFSAGPDRVLEEEGRRLAQGILHAAREAVFNNRPNGLALAPTGYQFMAWKDNAWKAAEDEDPFWNIHALPQGMLLKLNGEEPDTSIIDHLSSDHDEGRAAREDQLERKRRAKFFGNNDKKDATGKNNTLTPQILLMSSGEHTPFVIRLQMDSTLAYEIATNTVGKVEVRRLINPDG